MVNWSVVIPVKRLSLAKTRLRGAVPGLPHEELVLALAADTVVAAVGCPRVTAVLVVTDEPVVRETVARLDAEPIADVPAAGLNPALSYGAEQAVRRRPDTAVAVLGADLPALRSGDLAEALAAAEPYRRAYLSDAERTGTVLLTAGRGAPLEPRFGVDSARAHAAGGAVELEGGWPSLRRDVDTAADLAHAVALGVGTHTARVMSVQATVATFDPDTRSGTALLDDGHEVTYDAAAFDASGLRHLRLGQRITLQHDEHGNLVRITIPTMP